VQYQFGIESTRQEGALALVETALELKLEFGRSCLKGKRKSRCWDDEMMGTKEFVVRVWWDGGWKGVVCEKICEKEGKKVS